MKKFVLVIIALFLGASFAACRVGGEPAPEPFSYITDKGTLVIGVGESFEPMVFKDANGALTGYDVDLANEVGKRMGVEIEFLPIDMNAKVLQLYGKKIDCLWYGISTNDESNAAVTYAPRDANGNLTGYLSNSIAIVVKSGSVISSLADLRGKVAALGDQKAKTALEANLSVRESIRETVDFTNINQAFADLDNDVTDAIITDKVTALYYANSNPGKYKILEETLLDEVFGIGFRDEAAELREEVQRHLRAIKSDEIAKELSEKWFGVDISK